MKKVQDCGQKVTSCTRNGNFQASRENREKDTTLNDIRVPIFFPYFFLVSDLLIPIY